MNKKGQALVFEDFLRIDYVEGEKNDCYVEIAVQYNDGYTENSSLRKNNQPALYGDEKIASSFNDESIYGLKMERN